MIDYTDINLLASKYNFYSKCSKVGDTLFIELKDKDTDKRGTLRLYGDELYRESIDDIEGYMKAARRKIDMLA